MPGSSQTLVKHYSRILSHPKEWQYNKVLKEYGLCTHIVLTPAHVLTRLIATSVRGRDSFHSAITDQETDPEKQCCVFPHHYIWELRWLCLFLGHMYGIITQAFEFSSPGAGRVCTLGPLREAKNRENDKMDRSLFKGCSWGCSTLIEQGSQIWQNARCSTSLHHRLEYFKEKPLVITNIDPKCDNDFILLDFICIYAFQKFTMFSLHI